MPARPSSPSEPPAGSRPEPQERSGSSPSRPRRRGRDERPRRRAGRPAAARNPTKRRPAGAAAESALPPFVPEPWSPKQRRDFRIGLALAVLLIGAFYGVTMCRWIGLGDTALFVNESKQLIVNSHVNNHRTALLVGYLFSLLPFGEIAFRLNLMSAVVGTAAMVLMYVVCFRVLRRLSWSLLATFSVVVMHSMWWHSTIVENYAFNALGLVGVLLLLLRDEERPDSRYFYAACAVSGLCVFNHVQMGSLSVVLFVYAILQRHKQGYGLLARWLQMAGWYLVGLLPYAAIFARDLLRAADPKQTAYWAIGGDFTSRMFDFDLGKVASGLLLQFLVAFPTPMLAFMLIGFDHVMEKRWHFKANVSILACFVINTFFFMQFHTWDKFAFLLPSFLVMGYFGVIGIRALRERVRGRTPWLDRALLAAVGFCVAFPPYFYRQLPVWGRTPGFWHDRYNNLATFNTHDCARYIADPNKRAWDDMATFGQLLFTHLPPGALFLDDDGRTYYPLHEYYQKYYQRRPDLQILLLNSWGFANWGIGVAEFARMAQQALPTRPVFLVSIGDPHRQVVSKLLDRGIEPRTFRLDATRWVYRLVRADGSDPTVEVEKPVVTGIRTGRGFASGRPLLRSLFVADESVAVQIQFQPTQTLVPVSFVWRAPSGAVAFRSEPFIIPEGATDVWSHLDGEVPRTAGIWTVEALCRGETLTRATFERR
jgi:hypothetical protein